MSKCGPISKQQLKMLHACWNLYAVEECDRDARLRWASRNVSREIASFNDLTSNEAKSLLDILRMDLERIP